MGCVPVLVHNYCKPYDYGDYNILDSRGDNLDLHHAPQGNPAKQVINGYDYKTGPVIALPLMCMKSYRQSKAHTMERLKNCCSSQKINLLMQGCLVI